MDDDVSLEEKQAFIQARADAYYMRMGGLADVRGYDNGQRIGGNHVLGSQSRQIRCLS